MSDTQYVTKAQYDAEIAALKAQIDSLKASISVLQRSVAPLQVIGRPYV